MRTIDPILESALANQQGDIILRVNTWNNQADYNANPSTPDHTWTCKAFNLFSTSANAELVTANDYALSDFTVFTIERGVLLSGVEYTIESGLMFVRTYQEDYGAIKITGSSYPNMKISIAGDDTYQNVIEAFCAEIGKTAVFKNSTDAWLGYQFFATGKGLSLNKAELFENLLKQKYTIMVYEESPNNLVFYTQDSYPSSAISAVDEDGTSLITVGTAGGTGLTSTNASDWLPKTLPAFYNDLIYCETLSLWVAVGASVAATSPDGITWTTRTIPAYTYNSITWSTSLNLFVAIGGQCCATSPDGITWTARTLDFLLSAGTAMLDGRYDHASVELPDGRIVIMGGTTGGPVTDNVYFGTISGNTISWVAGTALPETWTPVASILPDGRIIITGGSTSTGATDKVYFGTISGNTISWVAGTALPSARSNHTASILPDGRIITTGGSTSAVYLGTISGNTISWATGTALPSTRFYHTASILADGRIIITGGYTTGRIDEVYFGTISGNTISWAAGTALPSARYYHTASILPDGRIIITGGYTTSAIDQVYFGTISGNTISWSAGTALTETKYGQAASLFPDGRLVITGGSSGGAPTNKTYLTQNLIAVSNSTTIVSVGENKCSTSTDGATWTARTIPAGIYNSVTFGNSLFVAVGSSVCATSPDGTTWTARTIPAGTYNGVTYGNSLFVAVGSSVCATSPDGTTWTARTPAALNNWQDVIWVSYLSLFVAVANNGSNRIMFSADGISWSSTTANADFDLSYDDGPASYLNRDQSAVHYLWRDETASLHTDGDLTNPQWNLGYLESTDAPPSTKEDAYYKIYLKKAPVRLDITDSDKIHFTPYWSIDPTRTIDAMMTISEHLNLTKSPAWYQEIKSISIFAHTEGGALPSTIERVAAYTPLVSTGFDGNLSPAVNNLQAFAQAVDDMTLGATPAWGAITGTLSDQTDLQTALNGKVDENAGITAGTKTKITYDAKGLVTGGADATTADIADSTNKRYVTDANLVVIGNTSGANTGDNVSVPVNGWIPASGTWTYVTAKTFTEIGDVTAKYKKGTLIKYTQTTVKYATVALDSTFGSGVTTVTIIVSNEYPMTSAAISLNYYSYSSPPDFPSYFSITPTTTGLTTPIYNSQAARYSIIGKSIFYAGRLDVASWAAQSSYIRLSLPVDIVYVAGANYGVGTYYRAGTSTQQGTHGIMPLSSSTLGLATNDASDAIAWEASARVVLTWSILYNF